MKARKIYESPDAISWPHLKYNKYGEAIDNNEWTPEFGDPHSYPFWYENGEFVLGREYSGHPTVIGRDRESFSGRVWADRKLISFWSYPSKFQFVDIAKELSERLVKNGYDADILSDPEWKVEVLPSDSWRGNEEGFQTELIPAKDYKGSGRRSTSDLGQDHLKSPMDTTKKSPRKYIKKRDIRMRYAMGENQLVPESLDQLFEILNEGVGDKYAQRAFGIPDEEEEYEKKYQGELASKKGEKFDVQVKGNPIVKNPKSLKNFPPGARGIITKSGDVYLVPNTEDIIHIDITKALREAGVIKAKPTGWEEPETAPNFDFIAIQRAWNKEPLALSESYVLPKPREIEERNKALKNFLSFFKAAKSKNPNLTFINDGVKSVIIKMRQKGELSDKEYQDYKFNMFG